MQTKFKGTNMLIRFTRFIEEASILKENRVQYLKDQHKEFDISHDTLAKHKEAGAIIDYFASKADPTSNKAHTQWIVNQYKKKQIRQEDAPQIKSTLEDFADVKPRLEKKDLNQYNDLGELRDAIATQKTQAKKAAKNKKSASVDLPVDLEKLYDQDGVEGYRIPNKHSSIRNYGPAGIKAVTHWCTAANSNNNMFDNYKGGKYTMHFPNGEVLQFHHQSDQIMDKYDRRVNQGDSRFEPYEDHIAKFIHQTKANEDTSSLHEFTHYEPYEIDDAIAHYRKELKKNDNDPGKVHDDTRISHIARSAKLSDEHFNQLHSLPIGKNYRGQPTGVPLLLGSNKRLSHDQVGKLLREPDDAVRGVHERNLLDNPAVKGEHIDHLMESPLLNSNLTQRLSTNPNLQAHHIDQLIKSPNTHENLVSNQRIRLTRDQQKALVASPEGISSGRFASRKDIHPEVVDSLIHHFFKRPEHLHQMLKNPDLNLSDQQLHQISKSVDADWRVFDSDKSSNEMKDQLLDKHMKSGGMKLSYFASSPHFTKNHLDKMLDYADKIKTSDPKESDRIIHSASDYKRPSAAQLDRLVKMISNIKGSGSEYNLLNNKSLKPEHLKMLFTKINSAPYNSQYFKTALLDHPNTNSDVLHHVFDHGNDWDKTSVLHHPNTQLSHFQKAVQLGRIHLHGAISSSPSAPASALQRMSTSPLDFVRHNVAIHKNTPKEVIDNLSRDPDPDVAEAAMKRVKR